jgi:hypothetical protein
MTWFFVMLALFFVLRHRRRARRALWRARREQLHLGPGGPERWQRHRRGRPREAIPAAAPPETRFDALKRRFVSGELTDEQYEREVDALLRTPGGMNEV